MASCINLRIWLLNLLVFGTILLPLSQSRPLQHSNTPNFKVRGVNLGGWLLIEGWIKPSLFQGIPNKDFLDGTTLQFKSLTAKKYLCAQSGGGTIVVANCTTGSGWENFRLWRINETTFRFRVAKDQFVGLDGTKAVATIINPHRSATFEIIKESKDSTRVRIKASNGFYLQAKTDKLVTADASKVSGWKDNDPTVFNLTIVSNIEGDFQLQNGYGRHRAAKVMKEHYDTFITEKDFKFIAKNGINAVRIPVPWWATKDPNPPFPFVSGTLQSLDNAFSWAKKYGLKVILDLHSAPGSQNGVAHSTSRDGSLLWGKTNKTIQQTLEVIDFYAARYTKHKSLYAIELLNEPLDPYVHLDTLTSYYKAGYEVVRKYSSTVYVILSTRLRFTEADIPPPEELLPLASGLWRAVIDVHWYSLYYDIFDGLNAQQNLDYIHTNRTTQLNQLITANGPLTYIGEWSGDWKAENATEDDYKRFAQAQIQVYNRATFGWSFWTLKNVQNHWSLEWMIKNGYIKLI